MRQSERDTNGFTELKITYKKQRKNTKEHKDIF